MGDTEVLEWYHSVVTASIARRLLAGLFTAFLFLLLTEGVLRLIFPAARAVSMPAEMIASHTKGGGLSFHPDLGWYWPSLPSGDFNAQGFRVGRNPSKPNEDPPPTSFEKKPGTIRVVALGDSQTLGAGVTAPESWPSMAGFYLGSEWEVLNAAISGYRSLNIYRLIQLKIVAFHPDVLLIDTMPGDSPHERGPLLTPTLQETSVQRIQRLLWYSRLYYVLRLGLEILDPHRARWLRDDPTDPRPVNERGNQDLIAQWGKDNDVAVFFLEYPVMDSNNGTVECMTRDGELPANMPLIRACKLLQESGLPASHLFIDRNHMTPVGNARLASEVARVLTAWKKGETIERTGPQRDHRIFVPPPPGMQKPPVP